MQLQKRLSLLILTICLVLAMSMTAYAHEAPDMTNTGSISVAMIYEGNTVPGGTLKLYQVGGIVEDHGNYRFALVGDFTKSGVSLDTLESSELAETFAAYAAGHGLNGTEVRISDDGTGKAKELTLGLYLVVQTEAADGYEAVEPFLVSVPMYEDGRYLYEVDATPKMSTLTESAPDVPAPSAPPKTPSEPTLPQTGQLNWPIPVLAGAGLCLFLAGWSLRYKREQSYEA